jgi:hypothetical protein
MWFWIALGVGSFLGLSLLTAFALARVLGTISQRISALYETDWAILPPRQPAQRTTSRSSSRTRVAHVA